MTTQVIFKIDEKIKEQAQKKARERGLTYSDVLKMATYQFVDGDFHPMLAPKEILKDSVRREINEMLADYKAGRNISPPFTNADDMMDYLEKEIQKSKKKKK